MYNFRISFENPWHLLLLIPALFLTFFFYFRSAKKYRRNRNRITSIVLHLLVTIFSISVFAGIVFLYEVPNTENQLVLLVDMSDSGNNVEERRDLLVRDILDESRSQYNVGIILFGYDQVLAAPMSYDMDDVYRRYMDAPLPDTTATDIAAAFNYTKKLFTNLKTSKIVLISDGIETDGDAISTVRSVAAEGIRVDTVSITRPETNEVEIVNIGIPDYNVVVGDAFKLTVSVRSSIESQATLSLYDNDEAKQIVPISLVKGAQDIVVEHEFTSPGMHRISFDIANDSDTFTENNTYYSYIKIAVFDRILVLERNNGESEQVVSMLRDETGYTVDVLNIRSETENLPKTVNDLRQYDEVVLVNIANADMPEGFDVILNSYVHDYGGGLFTVGGNDENGEANAYNKDDLEGTLYQQMLPVQAINYTPPLGVAFLLDISGSMYEEAAAGKTRFDLAKEAIAACLQYSMSERDYCGIYALGDPAFEFSPLLPVPQMTRIIASMEREFQSNGTPYGTSIEFAGKALIANTMIEKRHIIIVSDGEPTDPYEDYMEVIERYADLGVTITIVNVSAGGFDSDMEKAAAAGNGRYIKISRIQELTEKMRQELELDEIKGVNYETFTPVIREHTSVVSGVTQDDMPELDGFYGTKIKTDAKTVLVGEYVPIYAQWKYGEGSVGSFMCDLNGTWSEKFISSPAGVQIVKNIVKALFPTKEIRPAEIDVKLKCENYSTVMSIFTDLNENERIEAVYQSSSSGTSGAETVTQIQMDPNNGYSRATFVITQPGIHEVIVRKVDAEGNVLATSSVYRVFSYSAEYEVLADRDGVAFMAELAEKGKGAVVTEAWEVFEGFEKVIHRSYDPRLIFSIAALVLFLLDIAVRKFKFKWLHEIVRERREKNRKDEHQETVKTAWQR